LSWIDWPISYNVLYSKRYINRIDYIYNITLWTIETMCDLILNNFLKNFILIVKSIHEINNYYLTIYQHIYYMYVYILYIYIYIHTQAEIAIYGGNLIFIIIRDISISSIWRFIHYAVINKCCDSLRVGFLAPAPFGCSLADTPGSQAVMCSWRYIHYRIMSNIPIGPNADFRTVRPLS